MAKRKLYFKICSVCGNLAVHHNDAKIESDPYRYTPATYTSLGIKSVAIIYGPKSRTNLRAAARRRGRPVCECPVPPALANRPNA